MTETYLEPFLAEHARLGAGLERIRRTAAALPALSVERRRRRVKSLVAFLDGRLARYAEAEERELFPVVARRLRTPGAIPLLNFDRDLVTEHTRALQEADPRDVDRLQELLYGLHALLEAHFRREQQIYLPLLDGRAEAERVFQAMAAIEEGRPPGPEQYELGSHGFPLDGTDGEKLAWAVRYAVLAPSSHNSQPWRFQVLDGAVELRADRSRSLPVVDPRDRELVISCGAALYYLRAALLKVGHTARVDVLPDPADPDLLARVSLGAPARPDLHEKWLFWAIRTRRTNRRRFDGRVPPPELLAELEAAAAAEGALLRVLAGAEQRKRLAEMIAAADRLQAADKRFRHELASWLRPNRRHSVDGMPGSAFGHSNVASSVGPLVIRTFDWGRGRAARDEQLALGSPVLAILTTPGDEPADWLAAGQALAHLLLRGAAEDVAASFLNQPLEVEELRTLVGALAGGGTPQLILRLGYAKQVPQTPRRPVDDVISRPAPDTG